jgi:hypothetical protein
MDSGKLENGSIAAHSRRKRDVFKNEAMTNEEYRINR